MPRRHRDPDPTPAEIERLLRWRPQLERLAVTVGSDRYPREVEEFFALLGHPVWGLPDYDPDQAVAWLADPEFVARADLRQVRAMLTACARGERFCDGWWGAVLRDRRLFRVLDRLRVLGEGARPRQPFLSGPSKGL